MLTEYKQQFMVIDLSLFRYFTELEDKSEFFVVGGVITVGVATAYWWYTLYKDRD